MIFQELIWPDARPAEKHSIPAMCIWTLALWSWKHPSYCNQEFNWIRIGGGGMPIRRSSTVASKLGVLDLQGYEFDSGIKGAGQRVSVIFTHAGKRSWRAFRGFITSYLGLHYMYVTAWALVLSWILYPEHNMNYTDALFQAVSAITLTGLNTVNVNALKTYQQVFIFVCPLFTHPLTVALAMVFYRLYLYRRRFSDIAATSKFQSKLRRAATTAHHEAYKRGAYGYSSTRDREPEGRQQPPAVELQLSNQNPNAGARAIPSNPPPDDDREHDSESTHRPEQESPATLQSVPSKKGFSAARSDQVEAESPATEPATHAATPDGIIEGRSHQDGSADNGNDNRIRFGDLPRPHAPAQERTTFNPTDMYRSLNLMQHQDLDNEMDENDGPPLVIKSPRDIELDEARGIHSAFYVRGENPRPHNTRRLSTNTMFGNEQRPLTRADTLMSTASGRLPRSMTTNYLSWTPTVGRNSAFIGLTAEQKEELGGIEYRALLVLRWFVLLYYVVIIGTGFAFFLPWTIKQQKYNHIIRESGMTPTTFSLTTVLSAFNNCGLCVLPSSLEQFWHTAYIPVVASFIIMAGNVATPIILRFWVWVVFNMSPQYGQTRETLGFLLDHPRRCFSLLFPSVTTWWLILTLLLFMVAEVALFMILNSGVHSPHENMSAGPRLLSAYFQSVTTRTTGLTMISIGSQHPAMLVLNVVMMYVAIYPVAMSIRKSNVYEEQALGRYYRGPSSGPSLRSGRSTTVSSTVFDDASSTGANGNNADDDLENDPEDDDTPSTLMDHVRRQLGMDVWSLVLGLMLIAITEGGSITRGDFDLFDVVYEVVSAHGTVGLSVGFQSTSLSLSGGFSNLGKLIMMGIMIRSRHRAMPYNIDRAVILKGDEVSRRDEEQENRARDAHVLVHREPSQTDAQWFPRVGTTASKLMRSGTLRRRRNTNASA